MANEITVNTNPAHVKTANGWIGVLFNICLILYYYFTYRWVVDETEIINSYGLSSPILFSKTLGWIVFISLIAEPFAIFYKLSYEHYNVQGPALSLPRFFIVIMFIARFFIRIVFFLAALESIGLEIDRNGMAPGLVGTFVFVGELVFAFAITDRDFVGKVKPTLLKQALTNFVLLTMMVLFAFLFNSFFAATLMDAGRSIWGNILIGALLFIAIYLPNTMVQFYSDWRASGTVMKKCLYILSFFIAFLTILLFGYRQPVFY